MQQPQVFQLSHAGTPHASFPSAHLTPDQVIYARSCQGTTAISDGQHVVVHVHASQGSTSGTTPPAGTLLDRRWASADSQTQVSILSWNNAAASEHGSANSGHGSTSTGRQLLAVACGMHVHIYQLMDDLHSTGPQATTPKGPCRWLGSLDVGHAVRSLAWHPTQSHILVAVTQSQAVVAQVPHGASATNTTAAAAAARATSTTSTTSSGGPSTACTGSASVLCVLAPPGGRACPSPIICSAWLQPEAALPSCSPGHSPAAAAAAGPAAAGERTAVGPATASSCIADACCSALAVTWGAQLEVICWEHPVPAQADPPPTNGTTSASTTATTTAATTTGPVGRVAAQHDGVAAAGQQAAALPTGPAWCLTHRQLLRHPMLAGGMPRALAALPTHPHPPTSTPSDPTAAWSGLLLVSCDAGLSLQAPPATAAAAAPHPLTSGDKPGSGGSSIAGVWDLRGALGQGLAAGGEGGGQAGSGPALSEREGSLLGSAAAVMRGGHAGAALVTDVSDTAPRASPLISEVRPVATRGTALITEVDPTATEGAVLGGSPPASQPDTVGGMLDLRGMLGTAAPAASSHGGPAGAGWPTGAAAEAVVTPSRLLQGGLGGSLLAAAAQAAEAPSIPALEVPVAARKVPASLMLGGGAQAAGTLVLIEVTATRTAAGQVSPRPSTSGQLAGPAGTVAAGGPVGAGQQAVQQGTAAQGMGAPGRGGGLAGGEGGAGEGAGSGAAGPQGGLQLALAVVSSTPLYIPRASQLSVLTHNGCDVTVAGHSAGVGDGRTVPAPAADGGSAVIALASNSTPAMVQLVQVEQQQGPQRQGQHQQGPQQQLGLRTAGLLRPHPGQTKDGLPDEAAATQLRLRGIALSWQPTCPAAGQHHHEHQQPPRPQQHQQGQQQLQSWGLRLHVLQGGLQDGRGRGGAGAGGAPAFTLLSRAGPIRTTLDMLQTASYDVPRACLPAPHGVPHAQAEGPPLPPGGGAAAARPGEGMAAGSWFPTQQGAGAAATLIPGLATPVATPTALGSTDSAAPAVGDGDNSTTGPLLSTARIRQLIRMEREAMDTQLAALQQHVTQVQAAMRQRFEALERMLCDGA